MFWKIYKSSALATIVSIVGAGFLYGGIVCLIAAQILAAVICIPVGIGFHLAADSIASNAAFKAWKKQVVSLGYDRKIAAGDFALAAQLYQANPGDKTLAYFETLNSNVAYRLRNGQNSGSAQQAAPTANRGASSGPKPAAKPNNSARTCRCPSCGTNLPAGSHFCTNCGSKLERARKCPRCGKALPEGAKFCVECGCRV